MNLFKLKYNKKSSIFQRLLSQKKGLTLVETLVAISILTIGVVGPLGVIAQALHTSYYTRDQMTAYYLAQEAVEYVRNLRDNRGIEITGRSIGGVDVSGDSWTDKVVGTSTELYNSSGGFVSGGTVELNNVNQTPLSRYSLVRYNGDYQFRTYLDTDADYLKVNMDGIYGETTGNTTISPFKREIYFQRVLSNSATGGLISVPQEFVMVVNVYWKSGSSVAKLTLREYFTNSSSKTGI